MRLRSWPKAAPRPKSSIRNCFPASSRRWRQPAVRFGCWTKTVNCVLQYQINAEPSVLNSDNEDAIRHTRLIQRVANSGQSMLVPPYSGTTDGDAEGNPTRYLLCLGSTQA